MPSLEEIMPSFVEMVSYKYSDIKSNEFENIIQLYISKAKTISNPKLVQIGGIPGAGKTTYIKNLKKDNAIVISFDAIMEVIPQYKDDIKKLGSVEAFKKWEMPARVIGYEILNRAIDDKLNIILEHSGVNEAHIQLFTNIKKVGYETEVNFILCDVEKAMSRAKEREKLTNRHTPEKLIRDRAALVSSYIPRYMSIVDNFKLFDTSKDKLEMQTIPDRK